MLISAGMITKNAAEYIKYSVMSFIDYVGELIIVDDQSTDDTIAIAKEIAKKKLKVVRGEFNGDKKRQRNEYLKKARGDWIITPDADEVFYQKDMDWLIKYLANKDDEIDPAIFIGIHHRTFWMDFCHVIEGLVYSGVKHRIFKNISGIQHKDFHYAVNLNKDELLHTHAVTYNKRNRQPDFKVAHYSYTGKSEDIRRKIAYYMRRDNPNCKTHDAAAKFATKHPYFSGNFDQPRYGENGLYCCGSHGGQKDIVSWFDGEHPKVMLKHPQYKFLHDYVKAMNKYMFEHWRFHNHLHHERHQERIKLTGKHCIGNTVDVGCANGDTTKMLTDLYPDKKFCGVEPTDWGFKKAVASHPELKFYQALGENMPFQDGAFDTVLLSEIIEHTYDPVVLMKEAWRVAKKRVIVTTPSQEHPDPDHKRFYMVDAMGEFLKPYGRNVTITGLTRDGKLTDKKKDIYFMISMVDK